MKCALFAAVAAVALACSGGYGTSSSMSGGNSGGGATYRVTVGDNYFQSAHNNTQNPAVDTIPVGATLAWNWVGAASHSVQSTGSLGFISSETMTGVGKTYSSSFSTAGTYTYDCAVHGTAMTGRVVVTP